MCVSPDHAMSEVTLKLVWSLLIKPNPFYKDRSLVFSTMRTKNEQFIVQFHTTQYHLSFNMIKWVQIQVRTYLQLAEQLPPQFLLVFLAALDQPDMKRMKWHQYVRKAFLILSQEFHSRKISCHNTCSAVIPLLVPAILKSISPQ